MPAAERGATRIADRVVAKLAAQAAREALRSVPAASHVPPGRHHAPHATVVMRRDATEATSSGTAHIRVAVELGYPCDIGAQCGLVRRNVELRVSELAGVEVPDVAVDVERLHSAQLGGGTPGRVS